MIKLILWDVDGTLLDFHASQAMAVRTCFADHGLGECTDEMLKIYDGINRRAWQRLERGEITKEQTLLGRFVEFFEAYGLPVEVVPSFNDDYQIRLGDFPVFCPHAKETVLALKEKGILQFAVTNGTIVAQERKLANTGLDKLFDEIFISDRVGVEKPNKGFFDPVLAAADSYVPGIAKEEIMIVGDSLTSDMQGGRNIGIKTCWYRDEETAKKEHPPLDHEITDLAEILCLIFPDRIDR